MKVGRNSLCPCGSGKKSKKCCGGKSETLTAQEKGSSPAPAECSQLVALLNAKRYEELENRAETLIELFPDSGFVWKILGYALQMEGKDALPAVRKAAELLPDDAEAHNNLGNTLKRVGLIDDAAASYRRSLAIKPDYAAAHNNLGNTLKDLGQLGAAEASYKCALAIKPDYVLAHYNLGNALKDLGRIDAAEASYCRALTFKPDFAQAHNNLGTVQIDLGRRDDAEASYRRALAIKPDYAEAHNNLGIVLKDLGRLDDAEASYRRALAINPDYVEAHNNLGIVLKDFGRLDAAEASYRRALESKADYVEAYNNLGVVQKDLGRLVAAEASYRRALAIKPDFATAHYNLAVVLKTQSRIPEAEISCSKSLEANPTSEVAAVSTVFMANMAADKGEFEKAERLFRQAISLESELPEAWAGIARTRKMTADERDAAWLAEVQKIAENCSSPRKEAPLRYSIGKYYDDVKNFEQAFLNYQRANELTKVYCKKYVKHHRKQAVDAIIHFYDSNWIINQKMAEANDSERPVFIVGMPRSGTSLAEQILASHPAVFGAGELTYWETAMQTPVVRKGGISKKALRTLADKYVLLLEGFSAEALRIVDKMPSNFHWLGLIHAAFPNARIIHMQRNPIDTCLSIYFQNFETHSYANDLGNIAHVYTEYVRLMEHWRVSMPQDVILDVPYEGLVDNQESWSRAMLAFIGLPWDARCLDFQQTVRRVSTASNWQVRQKINSSSVERWRNYEKFVGLLRALMPQ